MRWSRTFIPTLREVPQEAEIASHRLMLRAGLIRKLSSGLYTYLPLGLRVLRKVERIVREEMDRAGAIELLLPILQPREIWEKSGRWKVMEPTMLTAQSHQGRELVLGPTHEEVITGLVAREISSYKQLPRIFYQIAPKFRDEIRPRFGVMRAREFLMKDAYSFDVDGAASSKSYRLMYDAYGKIFDRCGLKVRIVEADTGVMGGNFSHEFMVPGPSGEDAIISCPACGYAANVEQAERKPEPARAESAAAQLETVDTPGLRTVAELAAFFKAPPASFIKTLIYRAGGEPRAVLVRGDRDVNESKLKKLLGADSLELADEATILKVTGAPLGFAGPVGLGGVRILADFSVAGITDGITGANREDRHLIHVSVERDCPIEEFHDLALVREGDLCPRCGKPLEMSRGTEVGHVFQLGTKYSAVLGATFKDQGGKEIPAFMGCYGIGVSRTMAAVVEQNHDEKGIVWPESVAPYQVLILTLDQGNEELARTAALLEEELARKGVEVLWDDRPQSPGVKFNDADLLGIPRRITLGKRFLKSGRAELKERGGEEVLSLTPEETINKLRNQN
jgi:prolyl-tRNA synthetase